MGTKWVFLLGLIVCWTAVCNGEYGFMFDSKLNEEFKRELADENLELFNSDVGDDCSETACGSRQKCDEVTKKCVCVEGLSGGNCEIVEACTTGKFKDCKSPNGTCDYSDEKNEVVCTCDNPSQKLHPLENRCRATCNEETDCENGGKCDGTDDPKFCSCKAGLYGDKCEKIVDCLDGKYKGCKGDDGTCTYEDNKAICTCTGDKKLHDTENICKVVPPQEEPRY